MGVSPGQKRVAVITRWRINKVAVRRGSTVINKLFLLSN